MRSSRNFFLLDPPGFRGQVWGRNAMVVSVCLALSFYFSPVTIFGDTFQVHDQVVATQDGYLRVSGQKQVAEYHLGTAFTVEAVQDGWLWVTFGRSGWIRSQEVMELGDDAVIRLTNLVDQNPDSAKNRNARASVLRELGEFEKAISDHDTAIRICPSGWHYANRGRTWVASEKYDNAIADYNEAIRRCPIFARFFALRSVAWLYKNDERRALGDANEAIRLDSDLEAAYRVRSSIHLLQGRFEEGIRDCDDVIRLNPMNPRTLCNRARAWIGIGQLDKATADCDTAIHQNRSYASPYFLRGLARYMKGDIQAIGDFQTSIELDPENSNYAVILGYILCLKDGDKLRSQLFIDKHAKKLKEREYLPAIQYLRGEVTDSQLVAAIHALPSGEDSKPYKAELFCFIALKQLAEGRSKQALMSLLTCIGLSERGLLVRDIAVFELTQLLVQWGFLPGRELPLCR